MICSKLASISNVEIKICKGGKSEDLNDPLSPFGNYTFYYLGTSFHQAPVA